MMTFTPIPFEFLEEMEELSDAEYGRLIRWGQEYHRTGNTPKLSGNERFFAKRMQMQIDRFRDHYNDKVAKCKEAGRKGRAGAGAEEQQAEPDTSGRQQTIADDSGAPQVEADASGRQRTLADAPQTQTQTKTKTKTKTNASIEAGEARRTHFVPPTLQEVAEYCRERKSKVDPERFVCYYTSVGWHVGKAPMRDWRAAVRTWES